MLLLLPTNVESASSIGAAYVYSNQREGDRSRWELVSTLTAPSSGTQVYHDYFGWSVSMHGDTIIVGAYGDKTRGSSAGE